ncbi:MAG TPA: DUF4337 family protein [Candidatus Binataceae bacterium]
MPDAPEVNIDKLHEQIHEEVEREEQIHEEIHEERERAGGSLLRTIALTTALFAALAAVSSLRAGGTVNEALVLKTEATRLQAEISDQWADYQAKGIKAAIQQASESAWIALGKQPPASFAEERTRYAKQKVELQRVARELEHERDRKSAEADHLLFENDRYSDSVALFQVAIALGAVAALPG